jgi:hypothetical protein
MRMLDEDMLLAIDRLDLAVARAEACLSRPPAAVAAAAQVDPALEERHRRLREEAEAAVARIDRLLEEERG